jgi:hypothetical protein
MWRLGELRYDEGIEQDEVLLLDDEATGGKLTALPRDVALDIARARGLHLIPQWPAGPDEEAPACFLGHLSEPLRWERLPDEDDVPGNLDPRLWFEASCGERDLLVGNPHTFRGRLAAWCPHRELGYNVSLSELGEMSDEARYFVRGFLRGSEPEAPYDDDGELTPEDEAAWRAAIRRFRRTGSWYGRWGTCEVCGCVLLPDTSERRCHDDR